MGMIRCHNFGILQLGPPKADEIGEKTKTADLQNKLINQRISGVIN
jgi:hypothetical protein